MKKAHGIVVEKYAYQKAMKKKGASKKEDETAKPEEAPS